MMNYIVLICARGGSKGLPNKNIYNFLGKPLISWAISMAKRLENVSRVIVSTDSESIAEIAINAGAEVPFMRPDDLSTDESPEWLSWRHAIKYLEKEGEKNFNLIVLPTTSPLRREVDVNNCITEFEKGNSDVVITVTEPHRNPYFNMVQNNKLGFSEIVVNDKNKFTRRQDSPEVFDMTTVAFVASVPFVKEYDHIFEGRVRSVEVPKKYSIDIDTFFDMEIAEFLGQKMNMKV